MITENTSSPKHTFWEFKKYKEDEWFKLLVQILLVLVVVYVGIHHFADRVYSSGLNYEYAKLDAVQVQQVNKIYFDSLSKRALIDANLASRNNIPSKKADTATLKPATQSVNARANKPILAAGAIAPLPKKNTPAPTKAQASAAVYPESGYTLHDKAMFYVANEFNNKIDIAQINEIKKFLVLASPMEASAFLQNTRFKVSSNFWLIGPAVYWEIVFWSWFGVLSSILFNMGLIVKNSTTVPSNAQTVFDSSEIPSQFAKLLYAPMCTLITIFGYNFFADENIVDISSSKGVVVFAFIGGFYSSRLVAFLDRLKEVVLPSSGTTAQNNASQTQAIQLENVKIELQVDENTLSAEQRNEIAETGLSAASVIVENAQTAEQITADKAGEDQSGLFIIKKLKPGKYIIKANWAKDILDEPVNLAAAQTVEIKNADETVVVKLAKSESSG